MRTARDTVVAEPDSVPRLTPERLPTLPPGVRRPPFRPAELGTGIVHLGCGAFHRAHQALITQHAIAATGDRRWGIAAVAMSRPDIVETLRAQGNLYTVLLREGDRVRAESVGAIRAAVHAPSDPLGVARRIADPRVHVVTLTVTASGYCVCPATGRLDADCDPVVHDLRRRHEPYSPIGILVEGLAAIRRGGGRPPTVLSCDNMAANGHRLRRAAIEFAALRDDRLAGWIDRNVQFPCSVVDRIVPPATAADIAVTRTCLGGLEDRAPVCAEPYLAWTIEDFDGERPAWELGGAEFVTDVADRERAKLRLLNGTHLLLAYLGGLAGHATVADACADPSLGALAHRFLCAEQGPTVRLPEAEIRRAADRLLRRFRNRSIRHDLSRVGRDGSDKLFPQIVAPMLDNIAAGRPTPIAALVIAAWIHGFASATAPLDHRAADLIELAHVPDPHRRASAVLARGDIFGESPDHARVRAVGDALAELARDDLTTVVRRRLGPDWEGSDR
ncbi:mannitol dehydrogenase family protein [Nocardia sp. NPDC004068]|uniref:mannitol dehydrogenase family protein n=1 Tax=Nocardia sp. NPDC004068 TaxID=3364303 RepID=UPI0036AE1820